MKIRTKPYGEMEVDEKQRLVILMDLLQRKVRAKVWAEQVRTT